MKLIKQIAFGAMLTFSAFCAVIYSSCSKDKCKDVSCQNDGVCSGGTCTCPIGVTGTNCETEYRTSYANNYKGNVTYTDTSGTFTLNNYHLVFSNSTDTLYNQMTMSFNDDVNVTIVSLPIILSNFSTTSSVITIASATRNVGGVNYVYSGTGTISGSLTTLVLTETPTAGGSATVYTMTNFAKQ